MIINYNILCNWNFCEHQCDRYYSVIHARIRNHCSNLNNDLYINHLRLDSKCDCEHLVENAEHYFFECNIHINQRLILFNETRQFHPLSLNILLFGNNSLSMESNTIIFNAVQKFIKNTSRFK